MRTLSIASRRSPLALAQAELVRLALERSGVAVEETIRTFETEGDRRLLEPLAEIGGKGLFTQELESALRSGAADIAVHSLKDLPVDLPDGLLVAAVLPREDPRDGVVTRNGGGLATLAAGSRIGTSSPRRRAQLGILRPDLEVVDVRGNVGTRLRRLDAGSVDALLMACAGLIRSGFAHRISEALDPDLMLPAPAQGIIALEVLTENREAVLGARRVHDVQTEQRASAERELLRTLGGGCAVPIGALATFADDCIRLKAGVFRTDGKLALRASLQDADPAALGRRLAHSLLQSGAGQLLAVAP